MSRVVPTQEHQFCFTCFVVENGFWGAFGYATSRVVFSAIQAECAAVFAIAANTIATLTDPIFEDLIESENYWIYRTIEVISTGILAMTLATTCGFSFNLPMTLGLILVKVVIEELIFEQSNPNL